jgi:chemotaxis protein CheD
MAVASSVLVGMAEIQVIKGSGNFSCLGLGSCIGLCMLDPVANVGGMAHVMLPEAFPDRPGEKLGKFANTAVPELIAQMEKSGAAKARILTAIAGGAQVFKFGGEGTNRLEIGRRNAIAVTEMLSSAGLKIKAQDVGGTLGRTVMMVVESGLVSVRTVSQGEKTLCNLRD